MSECSVKSCSREGDPSADGGYRCERHPWVGKTKPLTIEFDPAYIARVLRWAGIEANVSIVSAASGVRILIEPLDGKGTVGRDRLLSALILTYIDAGQPTRTIMEGER